MNSMALLDFLAQPNYFSNDDFLAYMSSNLCCHRLLVNKVMENAFLNSKVIYRMISYSPASFKLDILQNRSESRDFEA